MSVSALRSKVLRHGRSLSLPSTSNPATSQIHENLSNVKAFEEGSSSLSSFNDRISGLKSFYYRIDDFLSLPHIQNIISQKPQEKWVDQVLDGHIRILDACNTAKDLFSDIKHNAQDLLSAFRRKDAKGVHCYLTNRKHSRKMIQKSLKDLRSSRRKLAQSTDNDNVCMFKEAETATFAMLESLLSYVFETKTQAKQSSWSLLTKLVQSKKVIHQEQEQDFNDFVKVDAFLRMSQEDDKQVKETINHLKEMEANIRDLEEELECLFRQLIRTRVSLLNILNY